MHGGMGTLCIQSHCSAGYRDACGSSDRWHTPPHNRRARIVSESVDWELIRQCPAPLLIVKSRRSYQDSAVVAAVDPFHANAKPANLDVRLLQIGRRFARVFSGNLHLFHAYMPLIPIQTLPMAAAAPLIATPPDLEPLHQQQVERAIDRLAQLARIPKAHRHLQLGHVAPELSALANQLRAGVVVMGAVSRWGFSDFSSAIRQREYSTTCPAMCWW